MTDPNVSQISYVKHQLAKAEEAGHKLALAARNVSELERANPAAYRGAALLAAAAAQELSVTAGMLEAMEVLL
jgi:hypothetical protein